MFFCLPNNINQKDNSLLFLGHMKIVFPHYWLITPINLCFFQSICSLWLQDSAQHERPRRNAGNTSKQHYPRLSHNISVLSTLVKSYHTSHCAKCKYSNDYFTKFFFFFNDRMKQKNGSVHSETFKMKRQVWRKDAEINKCAHLGYTIFGVF